MKYSHRFSDCWVVGDTEDTNAVHLGFAPGWCETRYDDGTASDARPHTFEGCYRIAEQLGYGRDVTALLCEHEMAHTFVPEHMGLPHSTVVWADAHGITLPKGIIPKEERQVRAFQRLANTGERTPPISEIEASGADVDVMLYEWDLLVRKVFGRREWWLPEQEQREAA